MRVLIIGYSNIVRRRVLPALRQMPVVEGIDIASKTSPVEVLIGQAAGGHAYTDYETALAESRANLAYISLVNSAHALWVEQALEQGLHVIVDKPAFLNLHDAERMVELAATRGLCLAESTVYGYHPQIQLAREVFDRAGSTPTRLTATFSFPPLDAGNFRYSKVLGGGALWDLGPYAVSLGRLFFGQEPDQVFCRAYPDIDREASSGGHGSSCDHRSPVEIAFSILATYPGGRVMVGHFGFDTEYRNHLTLLGPGACIEIDRVFTTPAEMENELKVRANNRETVLKTPQADSFGLFIQAVADAIKRGDHDAFARDLMMDALALHQVRAAALHAGTIPVRAAPGEPYA